jgi:CCR4-NOT transcription complex subunit 1 HEAT repeat
MQEVKGLALVLERTPYPLAIELAALASQRGILALQPWLQVTIISDRPATTQYCADHHHLDSL